MPERVAACLGSSTRGPVDTESEGRQVQRSAREEGTPPGVATGVAGAHEEVVAFIRYCYQRRRIGWPELYDEMCGVAARAEFRDMDYDRLAELGVRFSLPEMGRLAALAHEVVADERRRRVAVPVGGADRGMSTSRTAPAAMGLRVAAAHR
jgi:hypothetical protein